MTYINYYWASYIGKVAPQWSDTLCLLWDMTVKEHCPGNVLVLDATTFTPYLNAKGYTGFCRKWRRSWLDSGDVRAHLGPGDKDIQPWWIRRRLPLLAEAKDTMFLRIGGMISRDNVLSERNIIYATTIYCSNHQVAFFTDLTLCMEDIKCSGGWIADLNLYWHEWESFVRLSLDH